MSMPPEPPHPSEEIVRQAVQRHVGVAALRKLRRLIDAEQRSVETDRQFVRRFLVAFALVSVAGIATWLWWRGIL